MYRLSQTTINRKTKSTIAAACYRSGDTLKCKVSNKTYDYSKKKNIDSSLILLPKGADEKFLDRKTLWDKAEDAETYKTTRKDRGYEIGDYIPNAVVAKELQISLPRDLSNNDKKFLAISFCEQNLVSKGLACDIAFHNLNLSNPHCHIMYTVRAINGGDFGKKERWINEVSTLISLRKNWEYEIKNIYNRINFFNMQE